MIKMVVTRSATGSVGKPGTGADGSTPTGLGPRVGDPKGTYEVLSDEPSALHPVMLVGGTTPKRHERRAAALRSSSWRGSVRSAVLLGCGWQENGVDDVDDAV
jgi:hypothetical protein